MPTCTDVSQFLRPILIDMGFNVQFCNDMVKCSYDSWYGHVWLRIKGKEYNDWIYFDAAAVTQPGLSRPLGQLSCIEGVDISEDGYDQFWLFERDTNL